MEHDVELQPGQRVTLLPTNGGGTARAYATRIERAAGNLVHVLAPIARLQIVSLPLGTPLRVGLRAGDTYYTFPATVVEHIYHPQQLLGLEIDAAIDRSNERAHYRLSIAQQPYRAAVVSKDGRTLRDLPATMVNLSGGGMEVVAPEPIAAGDLLTVTVPLAGEHLRALAQVVSVEAPPPGRFNYRAHCQFLHLNRHTQDRIIRHVFREQLRLLRRGLPPGAPR